MRVGPRTGPQNDDISADFFFDKGIDLIKIEAIGGDFCHTNFRIIDFRFTGRIDDKIGIPIAQIVGMINTRLAESNRLGGVAEFRPWRVIVLYLM